MKHCSTEHSTLPSTWAELEEHVWNGFHRTFTGWSAPSSEPYMGTLWKHLSNSKIFRGTQGTSSSSAENSTGSKTLVPGVCFPLCHICQIAKSPNKQNLALPSSPVQMFSGGFSVTIVVWNFSNWMSSLNSVLPHSQSTKISTSELLRRDFLDSIWTMLTCFSCGT